MTKTICTAPAIGPEETPLERQLREIINGLPFGAVAALVRQLLVQMGYTGVSVRRTKHKGHNGRVLGPGGWDLEGSWETGLSKETLIVQVKHSPTAPPAQMRCVDELRGAMLRAGASHGLLVTTGTFSDPARQAALLARDSLTLVDGPVLLGLMRAYKVGLRRDASGEWSLDEALFTRLRGLFPSAREGQRVGESPRHREAASAEGATAAPSSPAPSPLTLTVITTALLRPSPAAGGKKRRSRP